jgi:hypothetical protein
MQTSDRPVEALDAKGSLSEPASAQTRDPYKSVVRVNYATRSHQLKTENGRRETSDLVREREMIKQSERELGGDIVGRGQAGSPGSDGASPELRLTCAEASRVNPGQPMGIPGLTRGLKSRANDFECRVR